MSLDNLDIGKLTKVQTPAFNAGIAKVSRGVIKLSELFPILDPLFDNLFSNLQLNWTVQRITTMHVFPGCPEQQIHQLVVYLRSIQLDQEEVINEIKRAKNCNIT